MTCNCEKYREMLYTVVDELDLSESALEKHGPMGTETALLVREVLAEKDRIIAGLKQGFKVLGAKDEKKQI